MIDTTRKWFSQLLAATIKGAAHAGAAWLTLAAAHGAGMDVPALNWKALGVILLTSGLLSLFTFLDKKPLPDVEEESKPNGSLPLALFLLGFIAFFAAQGCSTTQSTAYKTELAAQTAVETALSGWDVYVQSYHPPVDQERKVKKAFETYRASELLAIDATQSWVRETNSPAGAIALQNAQIARARAFADLIELIKSLEVK